MCWILIAQDCEEKLAELQSSHRRDINRLILQNDSQESEVITQMRKEYEQQLNTVVSSSQHMLLESATKHGMELSAMQKQNETRITQHDRELSAAKDKLREAIRRGVASQTRAAETAEAQLSELRTELAASAEAESARALEVSQLEQQRMEETAEHKRRRLLMSQELAELRTTCGR